MTTARPASHANVLEAQIKSIAEEVGAKLPSTAFSKHFSADVPIALPVRIGLHFRVNSTSTAGEKPTGRPVSGSTEASSYLTGLAVQRIDADQLAGAVRTAASSAKKIIASDTVSMNLAAFAEQASTVQACSKCRSGRLTCNKCLGSGEFGCAKCDGRGKLKKQCSTCGGNGKVKCFDCHGAGHVTNHYQVLSSDGTRYNHEMRYERCSSCGGSGYAPFPSCGPCSGSGQVSETCGNCRGSGKVSCSTCSGQGSVTCDACKGHAKTTTIYQLEPYITATRGAIRAAAKENEAFIAGSLNLLARDPQFAPRLAKFGGAKSSFDAEYQGTVPIGGVAVTAAGRTFQVYAIGPSMTWTAQPGIVDALLGDLLARLKATRSASLSDIPKLVGSSKFAATLVENAKGGKPQFNRRLLPGLSQQMAESLQREVSRLVTGARKARTARRFLYIAASVALVLLGGVLSSSADYWFESPPPGQARPPQPDIGTFTSHVASVEANLATADVWCWDGHLNQCTSVDQAYAALMRGALKTCWTGIRLFDYLLGARPAAPCWLKDVEQHNQEVFGAEWTEFKTGFVAIAERAPKAETLSERQEMVEGVRSVTARFVKNAIAPAYMRRLNQAEKAGNLGTVWNTSWGSEQLADLKRYFSQTGYIYFYGWGEGDKELGYEQTLRTILQFNPEKTIEKRSQARAKAEQCDRQRVPQGKCK